METKQQFEQIMAECRELFVKKLHDYGVAWRIMRPSSLTDQIYIKANRIRSLETKGVSLVGEGVYPEFIGIVNYGIIALIQLEKGYADTEDISVDEAIAEYDKYARQTLAQAQDLGLVTGYEDGSIRPKNTLTRAEGVALLMNLLDCLEAA